MVDPAQLQRLRVFAGLNKEQREFLAGVVEEVVFNPDQTIVSEGDTGDCMYVLSGGVARVFKTVNRGKATLATLEPGDFFGEISMMMGAPRTASVEARGECRALKLGRRDFDELMKKRPDICAAFLRSVTLHTATRLTSMNRRFADSLLLASAWAGGPKSG